jgi:hypothetical protein
MILKREMNKKGDQSPWILISLILALAVAIFFIYDFTQYNQLLPPTGIDDIKKLCQTYTSEQFVSRGLPAFTIEQAGKKIIYAKGFNCYYLSKLSAANPAYVGNVNQNVNTYFNDWDNKIKLMDIGKNETKRKEECEKNKNLVYVYSAQQTGDNKYTLEVTVCNPGITPEISGSSGSSSGTSGQETPQEPPQTRKSAGFQPD